MLLLLIRHGLTPETGKRLTGWTPGVGLSDAGRAQAEALVERLDGLPIDSIYSSPLERCAETAQPLARARGIRVRTRREMGEVHYGGIQGKTYPVLGKSKLWQRLFAWPSDVRFPDGEKLRETQARAVGAIDAVRSDHGRATVAIFSHADWITLALAYYAGVHIDMYRRLSIDPTGVSAVRFHPMGVQVRTINDTGALASLAPKRSGKGARR